MKQTHQDSAGMQDTEQPKAVFSTGIALILLAIIFLGLFIYVFWQKKSIADQIATLEERINAKQTAIDTYTNGKSVEDHMNSVVALEDVLAEQIDWSEANRAVDQIGADLQGSVLFEEYLSDEKGVFQLRGVAADTEGVAKMIERFTASVDFTDPFVSNLSEQTNTGTQFGTRTPQSVFPFSLTFTFLPSSS